jgi:hypothetical protein
VLCVDAVVSGWEKHNGSPIRKAEAEAERKRRYRASAATVPPDVPPDGMRDGGRMSEVRDETRRDETFNSSSTPLKEARALFVLSNTTRASAA